MAIFTYVADRNFKSATKPKVMKAQFGDGYLHRMTDIINNLDIKWTLTFKNRPISQTATIISFFETHKGVQSFDWTPSGEIVSVKVICEDWSEQYITETIRTLTATFTRVYEQ